MIRPLAYAALALAFSTGCQKKEETATPAPSASAAPVAAAAAPASTDIPTSEDFEQQALDDVNPQNMETEIDKLEKEIGK